MSQPDVSSDDRDPREDQWRASLEERWEIASAASRDILDDPRYQRVMRDPEWRRERDVVLGQLRTALTKIINADSSDRIYFIDEVDEAKAACRRYGLPQTDMQTIEDELYEAYFARQRRMIARQREEYSRALDSRLEGWRSDERYRQHFGRYPF